MRIWLTNNYEVRNVCKLKLKRAKPNKMFMTQTLAVRSIRPAQEIGKQKGY